jgi:hypothetical protein
MEYRSISFSMRIVAAIVRKAKADMKARAIAAAK